MIISSRKKCAKFVLPLFPYFLSPATTGRIQTLALGILSRQFLTFVLLLAVDLKDSLIRRYSTFVSSASSFIKEYIGGIIVGLIKARIVKAELTFFPIFSLSVIMCGVFYNYWLLFPMIV